MMQGVLAGSLLHIAGVASHLLELRVCWPCAACMSSTRPTNPVCLLEFAELAAAREGPQPSSIFYVSLFSSLHISLFLLSVI
jgi:hypothetical protein